MTAEQPTVKMRKGVYNRYDILIKLLLGDELLSQPHDSFLFCMAFRKRGATYCHLQQDTKDERITIHTR